MSPSKGRCWRGCHASYATGTYNTAAAAAAAAVAVASLVGFAVTFNNCSSNRSNSCSSRSSQQIQKAEQKQRSFAAMHAHNIFRLHPAAAAIGTLIAVASALCLLMFWNGDVAWTFPDSPWQT
jgi:hypothetical protein